MSISIGSRLGSYQISASIGAGGMGEVYRARDTRLGRDVALKTLPPAFARDADRMERLEREAQVLASLNHPHIAAIYGLEESAGVRALVMELVEGATLADLLAAGPVPIEEALSIARQIAEALEYAHEKGVVHRDLKPANIKITTEGTVKVLDFGLAKAIEEREAVADASSLTLTMRQTQAGIIVGTAAYMSPEQASGKPVDRRSDIWSFGVVFWEVLAGRRLFEGETISHTLADVLRANIDVAGLAATTPPAVRTLIGRCLDRDPKTRLRDIGEARVAIDRALSEPAEPAQATPRPPRRRTILPWAAAGLGLLAAAVLLVLHLNEPAPETYPVQFSVPQPPKMTVTWYDIPVLSPDGRYLAFTGAVAGASNMLWVRPIDSLEPRPIPGTEGAVFPFWSPDSRSVAFSTVPGGKLKKVGIGGSPPVLLCDMVGIGGTWSREGRILAGSGSGPVRQVPEAGGEAKPVLVLDKSRSETSQIWPQFLPDGKHFLFFSRGGVPSNSGIYLGTVGSKETKLILAADAAGQFSPPGYLLFLRQETLLAQPFSSTKLALTGTAFPVAENVGRTAEIPGGMFSTSNNGALVYRSGSSPDSRLAVFDRRGKKAGFVGPPGQYAQVVLSPDEKRVALERYDAKAGTYDIWILEIASEVLSRLTFDPGNDRDPVWSPDGRQIAFGSNRTGQILLYRKTVGGSQEELLYKSPEREIPEAWLKDGSILWGNFQGKKYFLLPLAGPREARQVYQTDYTMDEPNISPDGKWVAYGSTESGVFEVYTARFPEFTDRRQVSPGSGAQPRWTGDGRHIIYLTMDGKMMTVDVQTNGGSLETGTPRLLFETRIRTNGQIEQFAMSRDGEKFYIPEPVEESEKPITVVLNWAARYRR